MFNSVRVPRCSVNTNAVELMKGEECGCLRRTWLSPCGCVLATDPHPVAFCSSRWPCSRLPGRNGANFGDRSPLGTSHSFPPGWFSELRPHLGRFSALSSGPLWPLQLLSACLVTQPSSFLGGHFLGKRRPGSCCGWRQGNRVPWV